jgi:hypothetical protein
MGRISKWKKFFEGTLFRGALFWEFAMAGA